MPELYDEKNNDKMTIRQRIQLELEIGFLSCRELSQLVHQSEKEVRDHLEHLRLSLRQQEKNLIIDPPVCRKCGFVFEQRSRLAKPGKCPTCRHTGIEPPFFSIVDK